MGDRALFLGIDLGTTNSAAAIFDGTQTHLIRTWQGTTLTPSVVHINGKGTITAGARARRMLETDSDNVRGEFKRLMGTAQWIDFPASGKSLKPEELSAEVLKSLRADVREQFGFVPAQAVISAPALFELPQSSATGEAARLAGFERVELIQEPIASALAAGWTTGDAAGSWIVYDLGGGTFDVSLLETRDGLLRVVGHDGDNFLGGRDFDWTLVDFVLERLSSGHARTLLRSDAALAGGLRKIKLAVEEAKIELSRAARAVVSIPGLTLGGDILDVDVTLTREDVERLCAPLADRSIAVCRRLLRAHGLESGQLSRMVLVGGPTVMPFLRKRLTEALGTSFAEGLDPMTLVAQGAALYAASANLDARPVSKQEIETGRSVWLQYPAMTSDLAPYVVGRLAEESGPAPVTVHLLRSDGWRSIDVAVSTEGTFVIAVEVAPRKSNEFTLLGAAADGSRVALKPARLSIVHGVTLGDPPLSRAIGVALASNLTQTYFERGAPLPARRTFRHEVAETIVKGEASSLLRIPIVQGEYEQAHLCRLVGALEISGSELSADIPAGSIVELTLEVDRGGRLSARALTGSGQVFEEISHLLVPDVTPEALEAGIRATRERLTALYAAAFRHGMTGHIAQLGGLDLSLAEVERDSAAARGGDADAAQKARRGLLEVDASIEQLEMDAKFPELEEQAVTVLSWATYWVAAFGSPQDQLLLDDTAAALERARRARQLMEIQRRIHQARQIGSAAYFKNPGAWNREFELVSSHVDGCRDLPRAQKLVDEGRAAMSRGDTETVRRCTHQLRDLMPIDAETRRLGFESGLR